MDSMAKIALLGQYMGYESAEEVGNTSPPPADCPHGEPVGQIKSAACQPVDLPITNAHLPIYKLIVYTTTFIRRLFF